LATFAASQRARRLMRRRLRIRHTMEEFSISPLNDKLRDLPSVDQLLRSAALTEWSGRALPGAIVNAAREAIQQQRRQLLNGSGVNDKVDVEKIARSAAAILAGVHRPLLPAVVNATGIVIHTGLGRAPLAASAVDALATAAGSYSPVEMDLDSGERGSRTALVEPLLRQLTGAEAACVVNNNAAALVLTLAALAHGRDVIVSRGELIEIGGGFRLPEIMAASGAHLVEIGTTNRTRLTDYQNAIGANAAALLKVHPSNYRISGFAEAADVESLSSLAKRHQLPLLFDIGSGALGGADQPILSGEPAARESLAAGADVVMFSGDKLLGGPQAGIIVGREAYIGKIRKHPLMRAFRVDKLTLAALGATLQIHLNPAHLKELPVLRMLASDLQELRRRAEAVEEKLRTSHPTVDVSVVDSESYAGGGSIPQQAIASCAIRVVPDDRDEAELARRLRTGWPPVMARVSHGAVFLDMRTIDPQDDANLVEALLAAL